MKKILNFILRLIIGLTIVGFLIYKINFSKILDVLSQLDWYVFPLFSSAFLLMFLAGTINLKLVLGGLGEAVSFFELFKYNLIAKAVSSFLPGRLGEGSIAYLLGKKGVSYGKSLLALVVDKFITLLIISFFSIFAFFIFFEKTLALKLTSVLLLALLILFYCLLSKSVKNLVKKFILRKYSHLFTGFSKGLFYLLRKKKKILFLNFLTTMIMLLSLSLVNYLLFIYFGEKVFFFYVFIIHCISILSAQIPISIAGLGVRESITVYLYYQLGVEPAVSGTIYLLFAVFSYTISTIVLLYYTKRIKLKQ